ncbi:hypothetical protein LRAMOSA02862 [Lichtheimia ramosa]|uniref:Uncharacterized protein n=1 Tax=Lichtheimia ramosa TaxID=688394 RepID=A0A077WS53_9FUNG|nr:hypothetical protein LRAMOSA02862 [Lichtheimia ramosa]
MQTSRLWNTARRFMSHVARKNDNGGNTLNQQVLDEYMVPGQYLRYFKTTRRKKRSLESSPTAATFDKVYKESARSMHENDSAPTTTQQHFAQRIHRGINNMYSYESLPRWLTPSNVGIQAVKVGRNLRKCQIFYEAKGSSKEERVKQETTNKTLC